MLIEAKNKICICKLLFDFINSAAMLNKGNWLEQKTLISSVYIIFF